MTTAHPAGAPRLVIVDQTLRGLQGHHYAYSLGVARAARAAGLAPVVAAHRALPRRLRPDDVPVLPWFSRGWLGGGGFAAPAWLRPAVWRHKLRVLDHFLSVFARRAFPGAVAAWTRRLAGRPPARAPLPLA
ncbi:MAG TPA: hypothetical protein VEH84_11325, partial [Alphaproteobacteria bacterium]|nr:hypothetical protein [Alphaproteobacteria bacterium]